jgi:uncharacterized protein with HEPN domain
MALLERITRMKQEGINDSKIISTLQEEGISPKDINDALSQFKIKTAVSSINETEQSDMEPSLMGNKPEPAPIQQNPTYAETDPSQQPSEYNAQENYQDPYNQYAPQDYYSMDTATIREISKQEIDNSNKELSKKISTLEETKTNLVLEVKSMDLRIKKIESAIQEIQTAIIRKFGEYGEAVVSISKEVQATQEAFSKMVNPLIDKKREEKPKEENSTKERKPKPNSDGFENYFR